MVVGRPRDSSNTSNVCNDDWQFEIDEMDLEAMILEESGAIHGNMSVQYSAEITEMTRLKYCAYSSWQHVKDITGATVVIIMKLLKIYVLLLVIYLKASRYFVLILLNTLFTGCKQAMMIFQTEWNLLVGMKTSFRRTSD